MQSVVSTLQFAVAANNATGVIDCVRLQVNAGSFAIALAFAAVLALLRIDSHLEKRMPADKSEKRSDGTNRVAPSASVLPSQDCDDAPSQ